MLGEQPTFPGCVYDVLPIGLFRMMDQGISDERILAHGTGNARFRGTREYTEARRSGDDLCRSSHRHRTKRLYTFFMTRT